MDQIKHQGFTIRIKADTDPENPRTGFDNVSKMWCAHRRYRLGDFDEFPNEAATQAQIEKEYGPLAAIRPLYMYDHSGLTISTSPFSCPWDSGQIGWVFVTREQVGKEGWKCSKQYPTQKSWAEAMIDAEVKVYDHYLRGDVYGYVIENADGDEVDSCWGFYGEKETIESAKHSIGSSISEPSVTVDA